MSPADAEQPAEPHTPRDNGNESGLTVVLAFAANLAVALAKSAAAFITGSASMVAEAAHSWADAGNEVFLLIANRRSSRPPDSAHPLGFGRESYFWSTMAALGLFAIGGAVSVTHGIQELVNPEPATDFDIAYIVLGVSFILEGISFGQAWRQVRTEARQIDREIVEHALATSDPTLRAVFAEDSAALAGLVIAFLGVFLHQLTGSPIPDGVGSIVIGLLLGAVALVLIDRNRRFLLGQETSPDQRSRMLELLLEVAEIDRVTYLHMEYVGPRRIYLVASVDLMGDESESSVAHTLRELEHRLEANEVIVEAVLTLSAPDEETVTV